MNGKASSQEQESFLETQVERNDTKCIQDDFDEDTRCGFGFIRGKWMQKLASKKVFIVVHALTGMVTSSGFYYYSGTLTTLEKHYKFTSAQMGYIGAIYDVVATIVSLIVPYYCSKRRISFPKCMGFATLLFAISFFIYILPFILYGAGDDALSLTEEFGVTFSPNSTQEILYQNKMKELCYANKTADDCSTEKGDHKYLIAVLLFGISQAMAGCGGAIYVNLGAVYIDDNVKKSKAPIILCLTRFVHLLASAVGFSLASFCLKFYISPSLHPKITDEDPRWIGAWWIGYVIFAVIMLILSPIISTFPKTLPRAALRMKQEKLEKEKAAIEKPKESTKTSIKDLLQTFKRLLRNKTYFFNTLAGVFYVFGYIPFFFFQAKYIQIHFMFSASTANLITGTVSLVFSAIGVLTSGIVLSIFKPPARHLAMWNIVTSFFSIFGVMAYGYFSCTASNNALMMENSQNFTTCNQNCNCDFVQYAPICGENNVTYISSCHAGCTDEITFDNGTKTFTNCQCISSTKNGGVDEEFFGGSATTGACPVNCMPKFIMFFVFLCINKFLGGTEGSANFLLGIRCVEKRDKAISMGLSTSIISLLAIVPSPIFFGWIIDRSCVFWGKTCSKQGNCWLYDTDNMRYTLNMTAAAFILIGTICDIGTWYYSKDVIIFDDKEEAEQNEKELEDKIDRKVELLND